MHRSWIKKPKFFLLGKSQLSICRLFASNNVPQFRFYDLSILLALVTVFRDKYSVKLSRIISDQMKFERKFKDFNNHDKIAHTHTRIYVMKLTTRNNNTNAATTREIYPRIIRGISIDSPRTAIGHERVRLSRTKHEPPRQPKWMIYRARRENDTK